jgi:hypothetical protein
MRKSTIFISAVLTTFALVMLYGVVSAYQSMSNLPDATPLPTDTAVPDTPEPDPTLEPTATQAFISPEQAAQLAVQVVSNPNLLSAESSSVNGTNAYKITFTNNDVVYIGLDGQVLGVQIAPVVVNVSAPAVQQVKHKNKNSNNNSNSNNTSSVSSQSQGNQEVEHEDNQEVEHDD